MSSILLFQQLNIIFGSLYCGNTLVVATKKVSTKEVNKTGGGSQFQPEKIIVDSISETVKMTRIKGIKETYI